MMLGFLLIWSAVEISQAAPQIISPAATLWFLAVPIFDTVTMMVRRAARGHSPFHADAEHLHHLLVRVGFTVGETIGIMCVLAAIGCTVGLLVTWLQLADLVVALAFVATGFIYLGVIRAAWRQGRFMGRRSTQSEPGKQSLKTAHLAVFC